MHILGAFWNDFFKATSCKTSSHTIKTRFFISFWKHVALVMWLCGQLILVSWAFLQPLPYFLYTIETWIGILCSCVQKGWVRLYSLLHGLRFLWVSNWILTNWRNAFISVFCRELPVLVYSTHSFTHSFSDHSLGFKELMIKEVFFWRVMCGLPSYSTLLCEKVCMSKVFETSISFTAKPWPLFPLYILTQSLEKKMSLC